MKNTIRGETNIVNLVIGLLIFIVMLALFILYGLPAIRNTSTDNQQEQNGLNVEVNLPAISTSSSEGGFYKD